MWKLLDKSSGILLHSNLCIRVGIYKFFLYMDATIRIDTKKCLQVFFSFMLCYKLYGMEGRVHSYITT